MGSALLSRFDLVSLLIEVICLILDHVIIEITSDHVFFVSLFYSVLVVVAQ